MTTKPISKYQEGRIASFFDAVVNSAAMILKADKRGKVILVRENERIERSQVIKNDNLVVMITISVTRR